MDKNPDLNFGKVLLKIARESINNKINNLAINKNLDEYQNEIKVQLQINAAVFVTITINHQLRGCIGSLFGYRPLIDDLIDNAISAAFRDPRFPPLTKAEFNKIIIEVSLLTPPTQLNFNNRNDALAKLRPEIDGVILSEGNNRSTFLPQVWEQLPNPDVFIDHLLQKAGLPSGYWSEKVKLETYQVKKWSENSIDSSQK